MGPNNAAHEEFMADWLLSSRFALLDDLEEKIFN